MKASPDQRREREIDVRWHIASLIGVLFTVGAVSTEQRRNQDDRRTISAVVDPRASDGGVEPDGSRQPSPQAPVSQRAVPSTRQQSTSASASMDDAGWTRTDLVMQKHIVRGLQSEID
ncbi:hypothetical protein KBB08_02135 [Candidatus Gracilibacteria bacterium]|nr:hypothetical protein [Candidatus Gracilibacteria bacterium]